MQTHGHIPHEQLAGERNRLVILIQTLEIGRIHARDAGTTADRVVELRRKVADIDHALSAPQEGLIH